MAINLANLMAVITEANGVQQVVALAELAKMKLVPGMKITLIDKDTGKAVEDVVAKKEGEDLVIELRDGAELARIDDFYAVQQEVAVISAEEAAAAGGAAEGSSSESTYTLSADVGGIETSTLLIGGLVVAGAALALDGSSSSSTTASSSSSSSSSVAAITTTLTGAGAVLSTTASTSASAVTTSGADVISSSLAFLSGSTIDGGDGVDELRLSDAGTVNIGNGSTGGTITNVETLTLSDGTNNVDLTSTSFKTINGSAGNDTLTLTNLAAGGAVSMGAGNDTLDAATNAIIGGTGSTFVGGLGTDTLTFAASQTVTAAATASVSGFEIIDFAAIGGASTHTLSGDETTIKVATTNAALTVSGTGANLSNITSIVHTDGSSALNITATDAGATIDWDGMTLSGTGGDVDVITFQATGSNVLVLDGADVSQVSGTAVAAGGSDTLIIANTSASGADIVDATKFAAFENITLHTGSANLNVDDGGVAVARTITGNAGDNTITLKGISAAKTVDLSSGGTDTVQLSVDASATATISGFGAGTGGDILDLLKAADIALSVTSSGPIVTTGAAIVDAATDPTNLYILAGSTFQISGALTNVADAGTVEAAIVAAGFTGTTADGEFFLVALDNGTDTGVYRVTSNDTAITAASDIDGITLLAVLSGVQADNLVAANIA
jgi:hypothetical protein